MLQEINDVVQNELDLSLDNAWFRGHSSTEYKLLPTVLRQPDGFREINLFYDYKAHVASINNCNKSNWDLLLDMQHHGLPTRLLDWTSSLGTALYFALKGNPITPCIWVLDPFKLSETSTGSNRVFDISTIADSNDHKGYMVSNLINRDSDFEYPYSIKPPHSNRRISAQRGMFTVHTSSPLPIEVQCPEAVRCIEIPQDLIEIAKKYLQLLGIDDFSLFPDQEGLSNWLKSKYNVN
ncbi:FRG domain-containing protein [Vibrio splendidus]